MPTRCNTQSSSCCFAANECSTPVAAVQPVGKNYNIICLAPIFPLVGLLPLGRAARSGSAVSVAHSSDSLGGVHGWRVGSDSPRLVACS
ncbi:hypothetical protein CEXT_471561 [Caerostris extrusa]|uniref:Uncharacterized protein n=1 Tax=Caerostris extrusa TaxID=172846 RepID=A0AAV4XIR0_CAEEX|nr:hypothetical protein CEXT_471561 [Caerostris extrusa]